MNKLCIDLKNKCVHRVCGIFCMEDKECFINFDINKCNLSIKPIGRKTNYNKNSVKIK